MSRKLAVVFFALVVLVIAMGLKTVAAPSSKHHGTTMMANGGAPVPLPPKVKAASQLL